MATKKTVLTQGQMFYQAQQNLASADICFLDLVRGGLTRESLQACIDRRPALWGRYSDWLDKLPTNAAKAPVLS